MNKVLDRLKNVDFNSIQDTVDKKIKALLNDKDMQEYLKSHNFSAEDVKNDPYIFGDCLASIKEYKKHINNLNCFNSKFDGYILGVEKDGCNYRQIHELTTQMKKYLDETKFLTNYIVNDAVNLYSLSLKDLVIENETSSYLKLYDFLVKALSKIESLDKGLYIMGDLGIGKTYLMVAFLNDLARMNYQVAFTKTNTLMSRLKMMDNFDERNIVVERLKHARILVLDDLGSEMNTAYNKDDILLPILDYRMENKLLTFFTSNYDLEALDVLYSDYGKKYNDPVSAKRLTERINTLAYIYILESHNKRH